MKPSRAVLGLALVTAALWAAGSVAGAATLGERAAAIAQPLQDLLRRFAADPDPLSIAAIVLILGLSPFLLVLPMTVGCVLTGALLSATLAPPVILAGLLLNTALSWGLARTVFGRRLEAWLEKRGGKLGGLKQQMKQGGVKWVLVSRVLPAPFIFPPMLFASAGVPLGTVLLGTGIMMLPWSFAYAWAGRASREGSLQSLGLAGMTVGVVMILSFWLRQRLLKPKTAPTRIEKRNRAAPPRVPKKKKPSPRKAKA